MSIFTRLSHAIARRPVTVLVTWGVIAAAFFAITSFGIGPYASLEDRTSTGPPEVKGADSYAVANTYDEAQPADAPTTVTAQILGRDPHDPRLQPSLPALFDTLTTDPDVITVQTPLGTLAGPALAAAQPQGRPIPRDALVAADGGFLVIVSLDRPADGDLLAQHERIKRDIEDMTTSLRIVQPDVDYQLHVFSTRAVL